jgi:biopolymer transport protein ExbD
VELSIDAANAVYWNGQVVDSAAMNQRLTAAAAQTPQPELHIRAERTTPYEKVAQIMSDAAHAGVSRIGFVTDPAKP